MVIDFLIVLVGVPSPTTKLRNGRAEVIASVTIYLPVIFSNCIMVLTNEGGDEAAWALIAIIAQRCSLYCQIHV